MREPYSYNHFVPNFILKNFSSDADNKGRSKSICIYNLKENIILKRNTKKIFGEQKLYWDERELDSAKIEKELNEKVEQFALPVINKIVNCNDDFIDLSVSESDEIRRFFLTQYMRLPERDYKKGWEIKLEPFLNNPKSMLNDSLDMNLQFIFPGRQFKNSNVNDERMKMLDDLKIILKNDYRGIIDDHDCSKWLASMYHFTTIADIGIWRRSSNDEFIITDTYLTCECDHLVDNVEVFPNEFMPFKRNSIFLFDVFDEHKENEKMHRTMVRLLMNSVTFSDNVWFMVLSPDIIIVLVSPLFRDFYVGSLVPYYGKHDPCNVIPELYLWPVATRNKESTIYEIQTIDSIICRYINSLMLDRLHSFFGFRDLSKIVKSVKQYHMVEGTILNFKDLLEMIDKDNATLTK